MAINLPNFLGAPLVQSPYGELGDVLKNYRGSQADKLALALQKSLQPLVKEQKEADVEKARLEGMKSQIGQQALSRYLRSPESSQTQPAPQAPQSEYFSPQNMEDLSAALGEGPSEVEAGQQQLAPQLSQDKMLDFARLLESQGLAKREAFEHKDEGKIVERYRLPGGEIVENEIKIGPSSFEKELRKEDVKAAGTNLDALRSSEEVLTDLNRLGDVISENKAAFKSTVGPVQSILTKYFKKGDAADMLGQINALSGDITLAIGSGIKGAFTGKDQALIKAIKPNASDRPDVFLGKLNALQELTQLSVERMRLIDDYIREGLPTSAALKKAREETDFPQVELPGERPSNEKRKDISSLSTEEIKRRISELRGSQ